MEQFKTNEQKKRYLGMKSTLQGSVCVSSIFPCFANKMLQTLRDHIHAWSSLAVSRFPTSLHSSTKPPLLCLTLRLQAIQQF